jgi:glycerophosphoryl diester phosphodiesterase
MIKLKLPKIIGHRGCAGYAPENTLEAIHTAADMDVKWVELDVKLTKDQVPVIFHDETLERTTNGSGFIADITYDDLRELEAGSWFSDSFAGVKIPTLEEALEAIIDRDLGFNLEIKPCPGREVETAEVALDHLSHVWDDNSRLLISSYKLEALEVALNMASGWATGAVLGYHSQDDHLNALKNGRLPDDWMDLVDALKLRAFSIDQDLATNDIIKAILGYGVIPIPYNVNDLARAHMLQALGVQTVISDEPDVISEGLFTVH